MVRFVTSRALLPAVLLVSGCTVGPGYNAPETTVPPAWGGLAEEAAAEARSSTPTGDPSSLAEWWTGFKDPTLDSLIEQAVHANPDLRAARARVREARAQRGVVSADLFPTVDVSASYSRSRTSENSFAGTGVLPGTEGDLYQVGFDASWELDVFGGTRRNVEAADADIAASVEDRRAVLVTLLAEVATNYVELRGFQRRIEIAQNNLGAQRETLGITRTRLGAGLASDLDVARAEAQVQTTQAQIPTLQSAARQSIHALSVLLARPPSALVDELSVHGAIPGAPPEVPIGLPSDLLRRRPDVRRAERQLAAANARIGAATADLFPRFSLTGSLGRESSNFGDLADAGGRYWSIGPSVSWPILDFGRTRGRVEVRNAQEEQALAAYEQTVLTGLREVEDALVAFLKEQSRRATLASAADSNRRAVAIATRLYKEGLSDFLSVLEAQRDLFASEDSLVQSDGAVTADLVSLYKALGGGWEAAALDGPERGPPRGEAGRRTLDLTQN